MPSLGPPISPNVVVRVVVLVVRVVPLLPLLRLAALPAPPRLALAFCSAPVVRRLLPSAFCSAPVVRRLLPLLLLMLKLMRLACTPPANEGVTPSAAWVNVTPVPVQIDATHDQVMRPEEGIRWADDGQPSRPLTALAHARLAPGLFPYPICIICSQGAITHLVNMACGGRGHTLGDERQASLGNFGNYWS